MGTVLSKLCISSLIILVSYPHRSLSADLDASGYQSASGPNTTIRCSNNNCDCHGAFSCYNTQSIVFASELKCYGIHSCSNHHPQKGYITNDQTAGRMWCGGANSCSSTVIQQTTGTFTLLCTAFLSCTNSYFSGIFEINARGAYSLYNSVIDSNGSNTNITLGGYNAGFHSQILCQSTDVCHIHCPQSGCTALHINCTGHCVFISENPYNITHDIDPLFDYLESITAQNNDQCNNQSVSITHDNAPFTNEKDNGSHRICCRGELSCAAEYVEHTSERQQLIVSAKESFESSSLNVIGDLFCSGAHSSRFSLINRVARNSYCVGTSSCKEITINLIEGNMSCFGHKSCQLSTIYTSGNGNRPYFYLLGFQSAQNATFYCKENDECFVICAGFESCLWTNLTCGGHCNVECNEYSACPIVQSSNASRSPSAFSRSETTKHPTNTPYGSATNPSFKPLSEGRVNDFVSTIKDTDDGDKINGNKPKTIFSFSWIWYSIVALSTVTFCIVCLCILCRKKSKAKRNIEILSQPPGVIEYDAKHVVEVDKTSGEPNLELAEENTRGEGSVSEHQGEMDNNDTMYTTKGHDDTAGITHAHHMANKETSTGTDSEYNNHNIAADEFIVQ
eukprot:1059493_1